MINTKNSPNEIVKINKQNEHILNRYNIPNQSKKSIEDTSYLKELNPDFIVDIINTFENTEKLDYKVFNKYSVPLIIDYLKKSHHYYKTKRLPEIEQNIYNLITKFEDSKPLLYLFHYFFKDYQHELCKHFNEEEEKLFPYAINLYNAVYFKTIAKTDELKHQRKIAIKFMKNHRGKENDLKILQNALLKYTPPSKNLSIYQIILSQLKSFQQDLNLHASIEENLLETKLISLESYLNLK
jgi:regulator of cell morphogenesis and NO signaling